MLCTNGHELREADTFCPQCGASSNNSGKIFISNEQLKPIIIDITQNENSPFSNQIQPQQLPPLNAHLSSANAFPPQGNSNKYLPAIILVVSVVIIGLFIGLSTSKSSPPTTTTLPSGPSISTMERKAVAEFNQSYYYYRTGSYANCSYDPQSWFPGYSFNCEIYNIYSNYVGHVYSTATSYPKGGVATWTYNTYPW